LHTIVVEMLSPAPHSCPDECYADDRNRREERGEDDDDYVPGCPRIIQKNNGQFL
jgi:hypothetical protein